ncbi:LuxR family transcriptional regulator [Micromonospora sp. NPDC049559]|uniref:LuxR family transcriptional regulator n=1 Tax=Micromonospora sp. NPDC049559 TaxID=3155923 RepID=UPI0034381016
MSTPRPPRYVLTSMTEATLVLRRLARQGWQTREGFALTDTAWDVSARRLVRYGRVDDAETVRLAVLASARGAGVVAVTDPAGEPGRALLADLGRLGPVSRDPRPERTPGALAGGPAPLVPEQRALLERLANGETIAAAAAAEFLSLRTANRRIAQARQALGVATTREAVLAYLRQRDRDHPSDPDPGPRR